MGHPSTLKIPAGDQGLGLLDAFARASRLGVDLHDAVIEATSDLYSTASVRRDSEVRVDYLALAKKLMKTETLKSTTWDARTLATWLRNGCQCVYCGKPMLDSFDIAYEASEIEHLLPYSVYPELCNEEWNRNLVCRTCNRLKGAWDANDTECPTVPVLYVKGSQTIAAADIQTIFDRAKRYVTKRRKAREQLFEKERELIQKELAQGAVPSAGT